MIALSYRREDTLPVAGRLYDRLQARFGKNNVFMDFDSMRPGLDFRDQIKQTIERCKVMVAIIGPRWVGEREGSTRRIDDPSDFVRLEISSALKHGIPVIPVLINGTPIPSPDQLPADLQGLVYRHALPLDSGLDFHQHVDRLISGIIGVAGDEHIGATPESSARSRRWSDVGRVGLAAMFAVAGWFGWSRIAQERKADTVPSDLPGAMPEASAPVPLTLHPAGTTANTAAAPRETPANKPPITGGAFVELTTVPSGASVYANGTFLGTTPLRREDLPRGETTFVFASPGFLPRELKRTIDTELKEEVKLARPASFYQGLVWSDQSSTRRPLSIVFDPGATSGTMSHGSNHGDLVVRFTGVWERTSLLCVTGEILAQPPGVQWTPESFTLRVNEVGNHLDYECTADDRTYSADLSPHSGSVARAGARYQGTIHKASQPDGIGVPLSIVLDADGSSGTQTQRSSRGDTVVRFNGVWEGNCLHAVTGDVMAKPEGIEWTPESFTLQFTEDGMSAVYECRSEGDVFTAQLSIP